MNKSNLLTVSITVLVALFGIIFGTRQCGDSPTDVNNTIEQVVVGKNFVDSLLQANMDITKERDSLTTELSLVLLNMPEDKETQVVTNVVTKYVYRDNFDATDEEKLELQNKLDSLQQEYVATVESVERTNEMHENRYEELLRTKLEEAAAIPCVTKYQDEYLTATAECINGGMRYLDVAAQDSLITTHTTSRKWFLGRKSYHVYITNVNPYVELTGTAYVIDKKLRRKAKRNKNN